METQFRYLFTPLRIGKLTVKNRICCTPHAAGLADGGMPGPRYLAYLERKARGGIGMIQCFGSASVHQANSSDDWGEVNNWGDEIVPYLQRLADAVHRYDCPIISQITHRGRRGSSVKSNRALWSASDEPEDVHREIPHAMDRNQIREAVAAYAAAARRLRAGGFDGVDVILWASHLPNQFLSPRSNKRTDEYGGSFDNRIRFTLEIVEAVRESVGPDFVVGARLSGDELLDDGLTPEDLREYARRLAALKTLDYFTITGSTTETYMTQSASVPGLYYPLGVYNNLSASLREIIRETVDVPVGVAGRIVDPLQAEQALADGVCDFVGMTRASIADPDFPKKAMAGQLDEIRQCTGASEGCIGRVFFGLHVSCIQNPEIGRELELPTEIPSAPRPKKVVVVGGGPAGLEAARVAAERGHRVVLFEQAAYPGGQVVAASRAPERESYGGMVRWLAFQMKKLGVDVRLGVRATADLVLAEQPDAVVVATGSVPRRPNLPGADGPNVASCNDVLLDAVAVGERCIVYDTEGYMRGPSAAEYLADRGKQVEIVTPLYCLMQDLDDFSRPNVLTRLFEKGVAISANTRLKAVEGKRVTLANAWTGAERIVEGVDTVVTACGGKAVDGLYGELQGRVAEVYLVGDANAPRRLHDAMVESTRTARAI
ncbi:MAG: FAD-dependent oxidoreductase [Chloroflexi bacterium]|nr:FAD-dependent oxidoreductase [Chloroflexota bacterium]